MEFDHNSNFVSDDILPNIVAHLGSYKNCSLCRMDFIRDEITKFNETIKNTLYKILFIS